MARTNVERVECDRCGIITAFDDPDAAGKAEWAQLSATTLHGANVLQLRERATTADLCPKCRAELVTWFAEGGEPE